MPTLGTRPSVVLVVMVMMIIVVPVVMVMFVVIILVPPAAAAGAASPFASGARVLLPLAILFFVIGSVIIVAHFAVTPDGVFVDSSFFRFALGESFGREPTPNTLLFTSGTARIASGRRRLTFSSSVRAFSLEFSFVIAARRG